MDASDTQHDNMTIYDELNDQAQYSMGMGAFGILLAVWIIIVNGGLIIGVLTSKERRNDNFLLHIFNIAVADIFVGILVLPIMADYMLAGSWHLGEEACQFWIITNVLMCTVSIIAIVMISYDRFIYLVWPKFYTSGWKQYILGSIMILLPWVIGLGLVLPLWLKGRHEPLYNNEDCLIILERDFQIASSFLSFFVPAFFAICLNFAILMMLCVLRKRWQERGYIPNAKRPARQILTVSLVSLVFIVMWTPLFVLIMFHTLGFGHDIPRRMVELTMWLGYINSGVTPLLWLIYPLVRESYLDLVCCRKKPAKKQTSDETRRCMIEEPQDESEMRDI